MIHLRSVRKWMAIIGSIATLVACGGGGGGSSAPATPTSSGNTASTASSSSTSTSPKPVTFSIRLNWVPPSTRLDGSPLLATDVASYRIYYALEGSDPSKDTVVPVGGNITTLQITLTAAGTYTFAMTTLDSSGLEGPLSTPISVTVGR